MLAAVGGRATWSSLPLAVHETAKALEVVSDGSRQRMLACLMDVD